MAIKGYWRLNGDANDSSGNGYNGTVSNISYVSGIQNEAASFNGSTTTCYVNGAELNISGNINISISIYVKSLLTNDETFYALVEGEYINSKHGYYLDIAKAAEYGGPNRLRVGTYTAPTNIYAYITFDSSYINKWLILNGQYDGTSWKFHLNGVPYGTDYTTANGAQSNSNIFSFGYLYNYGGRTLDGYMDNIIIDNTAWSNAKIKNEYLRIKGFF